MVQVGPRAATSAAPASPTAPAVASDKLPLEERVTRGRGNRYTVEIPINPEYLPFLFLMAVDGFKRANGKMYPSWTDVLEVIRLLGYRKTMPSEIKLSNAEDWLEKPDTPSNVRPVPGPRSSLRDAA